MKNKKLLSSLAIFSFLAIAGASALAAQAATTDTTTTDTSSDKTAWHRGDGFNRPELSDEQKAEMEARRAEMDSKREAVDAAINSGSYESWVSAEKSFNENSPILEKVNADNFSRFVEAHKLRQQSQDIMKELGIERGEGFGPMDGRGHGFRQGAAQDASTSQE